MGNIKYVDQDDFEKEVDRAINSAIANLAMEGMIVTEEEIKKLKEEFLANYKIKILVKQKEGN